MAAGHIDVPVAKPGWGQGCGRIKQLEAPRFLGDSIHLTISHEVETSIISLEIFEQAIARLDTTGIVGLPSQRTLS